MIEVNKYENNPTKVTVCWDPMSNVVAYSKSTESKVTLLQTFWNKDKDRAWRMDIDFLVQPAQDMKVMKKVKMNVKVKLKVTVTVKVTKAATAIADNNLVTTNDC